MKIKTQFHLLIAGIILLPILTISAQVLIMRLHDENNTFNIPVYEEITPFFNENFTAAEWDSVAGFIGHTRPNTDITVFRDDLMVIYSTLDNFSSGVTATEAEILSLIKAENSRYGYSFESPPWLREGQIFILLRFDREAPRPPSPFVFMGRIVLSVIALVLLFVIIMSLLIARSITQSVLVLEKATRRIALGELDLPVDVKGSNEITSLTSSLNRMRLALKEEEQRRTRFIMGITHDLKTPLALIKGYAEAIGDGITSDPVSQTHSVEIIVSKADQLESMIDNLIDFVRLDTGEWRCNLSKINLSTFLSTYTERIKDDAELLNRRVETTIDLPKDTFISMDELLTIRAIENLVNNSLRYTRSGGLIKIGTYSKDHQIIIEVSDDGPGIHEEDIPHVFETFYRGTNSRREQGMGLGLAVVKGVVDTHGWKITVESEKGKGSCFRIIIPLEI
ncbi:HAMP domain-containing histidine kinase [Treponema primitia]|uniref:sensor histidine kinase n=1 Tax=Treponema primitia TaxID=88058 RepID=UPI00397FF9C6